MKREKRGWLVVTLAVLVVGAGLAGLAQSAEDEDFHVEMNGRKTWTLRYGFGDAYGLALAGLAANQLTLDQSLAVDITGEALSILTINAHFNDQEPMNLQSLTVLLDAGDVTGVFGNFTLSGQEAFAVYNKKLLGGRLDYRIGEATLTGILSQIEGTSESRTFTGTTAHEEVTFSRTRADAPLEEAPYREHLDGLFHVLLRTPFVTDFSVVRLGLEPSDGLRLLLEAYDLGYLVPTLGSFTPDDLASGAFTVVESEEGDVLLLKVEPSSLLRTRLKDLIKAYNDANALSGTARKSYPFNEGTAYEQAFLTKLGAFGSVRVDEESYPLDSAGRRRFYDLRRTDVVPDSVVVEISLDGGTFRPITDPDLADYQAVVYSKEGVIELQFPEAFFAGAKNRVQVAFDYAISGGAYSLGLSLVQGSEKVYLNGVLLARDVDYTIDYELGVLILFATVTDTDVIRIDYERFRGGLGGAAEYATNFYGLSVDYPVAEGLTFRTSLFQAADRPDPLGDPERARTMPNRHTVGGVVGSLDLDGFSADFTVGVNDDRFPLDDNARTNLPNEVTALLLLPRYTLVTHLDGVSVESDGVWSAYDASDGLSASRVYDAVSDGERVFFATASGLTVLSLEGTAPLDQVGNWRRYGQADGLPNAVVLSLVLVDGRLWLGTAGGFASVDVGDLDDPAKWAAYTEGAFAELGRITALAGDGEILYLGTETGLFSFDPRSGEVSELPGMQGIAIHDLLFSQGMLYAASDRGLRAFREGTGTGWLAFGRSVYAVSSQGGVLAWGSEEGLERTNGDTLLQGRAVTAVSFATDGALWAGTRADADYHLWLGQLTAAGLRTVGEKEARIDGRDRARFADISAEGHTDQGMIERFHFRREMDSFSVSGTFENVSPEFTAIGRLGRTDSLGWDLASEGTLFGGVTFDLSHAFHLIDRMTDPSSTLENQVGFDWTFGPRARLAVEQSAVDDDAFRPGFESGKLSYALSLSDQLFGDVLDLALRWRDTFTTSDESAERRRESQVSLNGAWKPFQGLSIALDASRPVSRQGERESGSERGGLSVDFTQAFPLVDVTASYNLAASRPLTEEAFQVTHAGNVDLRGRRFDLLGMVVTPTAQGRADWEEGVLSLSGQGTLRGTSGGLSLRATYGADLPGVGETQRRRTDRLSLGLDYTGLPDFKPSLSYTDTTNFALMGDTARTSRSQLLTGRLLWTPEGGPRDELSLAVRAATKLGKTTVTATLRNALSAALLETVTGELDLDGSYKLAEGKETLDLTLKAGADLRLTEMWGASLSGSLRAGKRESGTPYVSGILELFVSATF